MSTVRSLNTTETEKTLPLFDRDLQPTQLAVDLMQSLQLENDQTREGMRTALGHACLKLTREIPPSDAAEHRVLLGQAIPYLRTAGFWSGLIPKINSEYILIPGDCTVQTARRKIRAWTSYLKYAGRTQTVMLATRYRLSDAAKTELLSSSFNVRHGWRLSQDQPVKDEADMFRILFDQSYEYARRHVQVVPCDKASCFSQLLTHWRDARRRQRPGARIAVVVAQPQALFYQRVAERTLKEHNVIIVADDADHTIKLQDVLNALLEYIDDLEDPSV